MSRAPHANAAPNDNAPAPLLCGCERCGHAFPEVQWNLNRDRWIIVCPGCLHGVEGRTLEDAARHWNTDTYPGFGAILASAAIGAGLILWLFL